MTRRSATPPPRLLRHTTQREPQATIVSCPSGHVFGLNVQRFRAVYGMRPRVTCPHCGTQAEIPKGAK